MTSVVYAITNLANQRYVGATRDFKARKRQHRRRLGLGRGVNAKLQSSWRMMGADAHTIAVVASVLPGAEPHEVEQLVMESWGAELNVNLQPTRLRLGNVRRVRNPPIAHVLITAAGQTLTLREWEKITGSLPSAMHARRQAGYTPEEIVGLVPRKYKENYVHKVYIEVGGRKQSLNAWAHEIGLSPGTLHTRRHLQWTPEQVVGIEPSPKQTAIRDRKAAQPAKRVMLPYIVVVVDGIEATVREHCARVGLQENQVRYRHKNNGVPLDKCFGV